MSTRSGFTLFELGIVITIIAVIASGVLVGKSMINAAKLRTITTEQNIYTTAFKEFIDKYQAIPGDMSNATNSAAPLVTNGIWPTDAVCPTVVTNTIPKVATCNGNGNGMIGDATNGVAPGGGYEWFRAWQHLANAGLIEGRYTGAMGATAWTTTIGVNVPKSKAKGAGWTLLWMKSITDNDFFFANAPVASHTLIYGTQTTNSITDTGILTPIDAKNIDVKMDDGMPHTGNIRSKRIDATTCGAAASVAAATTATDYNVGSDTTANIPACQLMFILGM